MRDETIDLSEPMMVGGSRCRPDREDATDHISNQLDMTTVTTESGSFAKWVSWLAALVGPV